jgi:hypothetical protein
MLMCARPRRLAVSLDRHYRAEGHSCHGISVTNSLWKESGHTDNAQNWRAHLSRLGWADRFDHSPFSWCDQCEIVEFPSSDTCSKFSERLGSTASLRESSSGMPRGREVRLGLPRSAQWTETLGLRAIAGVCIYMPGAARFRPISLQFPGSSI